MDQATTDQATTEQSTTNQSSDQSTSSKSTSSKSTSSKSTLSKSTSSQSASDQATTNQSISDQSTSNNATTDPSTMEQSTMAQSTSNKATMDQSTMDQSISDQSTSNQATMNPSTMDQSTMDQSTSNNATWDQSSMDQSTLNKATTDQATTDQAKMDQTMIQFAGIYEHDPKKDTNYETILDKQGFNFLLKMMLGKFTPDIKITVDGKKWTVVRRVKCLKVSFTIVTYEFTLDEEVELEAPNGVMEKCLFTLDGHTITQEMFGDRKHTFVEYTFTEDGIYQKMTHKPSGAVGNRYFKRVKPSGCGSCKYNLSPEKF